MKGVLCYFTSFSMMVIYKCALDYDNTVVTALGHAPREARKACAIAIRALKCRFYIVKIDLVIASQRAVMQIVR